MEKLGIYGTPTVTEHKVGDEFSQLINAYKKALYDGVDGNVHFAMTSKRIEVVEDFENATVTQVIGTFCNFGPFEKKL